MCSSSSVCVLRVHRQLGVSISKVRSCVLDVSAWTPAAIELFRCVGNDRANSIWEVRGSPWAPAIIAAVLRS